MPIRTTRIRIPVHVVEGQWELLYGGPIKVKNGSFGELLVSRSQIEDKAFLQMLTQKRWVHILDQGTELRVALTIREKLGPPMGKLLISKSKMKLDHTANISVDSSFLSVFLDKPTELQIKQGKRQGGLWLELEGLEPRTLESSQVVLPVELHLEPAISVNHAFTLLSERFEPWRKSHTGNIYERVFYLEPDNCWYPLADLRDKELVGAERKIIQAMWKEVEKMLGTSLL